MTTSVRLTQALYHQILTDLQRPHPVAYERVGFTLARMGTVTPEENLILFTGYYPVPEDGYIADKTVGAHVGPAAITSVMQKILDENVSIFHTHLHKFPGRPQLSQTDLAGILPLVPSFQAVGPELPHGILLLSSNDAVCYIWFPNNPTAIEANKISVVGYPSKFYAK